MLLGRLTTAITETDADRGRNDDFDSGIAARADQAAGLLVDHIHGITIVRTFHIALKPQTASGE